MAFSPLKFPLYGLPDEGCPFLAVLKGGINPGESALLEPSLHVLGPHLFSSHVDYFSYELLTYLV